MNVKQRRVAIFDLDGCMADDLDRLHFLTHQEPDWEAYFNACWGDKPVLPVLAIYHALGSYCSRVVFTGRPERTRALTVNWMSRHDIDRPLDLYMRRNDDDRDNPVVKEGMLRDLRSRGYIPIMAFDDIQAIAEMYHANNVPCFLCWGSEDLGLKFGGKVVPATTN